MCDSPAGLCVCVCVCVFVCACRGLSRQWRFEPPADPWDAKAAGSTRWLAGWFTTKSFRLGDVRRCVADKRSMQLPSGVDFFFFFRLCSRGDRCGGCGACPCGCRQGTERVAMRYWQICLGLHLFPRGGGGGLLRLGVGGPENLSGRLLHALGGRPRSGRV